MLHLLLIVLFFFFWTPVQAFGLEEPCLCPGPDSFLGQPGVVWVGDDPLALPEISRILAPVLWFSPDEPLIVEGQVPLPHPHPCDVDTGQAVVYTQVQRIRLRGSERVSWPEEEDPDFWSKVHSFSLRYFFYYRQDYGLRPHPHDLEAAEFHVYLENLPSGCYQVRLDRVRGFAHGTDWYSNELRIEADTRFPLTLLIEEGKHATCPDRNADGTYTPGYDVNRRIHDAWGVRDIMAAGLLFTGAYQGTMTKPRLPRDRMLPPGPEPLCVTPRNSSLARHPDEFLGRYELRPANRISMCPEVQIEPERLQRYMRENNFGREYQAEQHPFDLADLVDPLTYTENLLPPVSARWDRALGVSVILPGLELREGYVVPKLNWVAGEWSLDALVTRSAAQFFSWYGTAGMARQKRPTLEGIEQRQWKFVTEVGVKFRLRVAGPRRLFTLGYQFAGVRLGVRNSGFDHLRDTRLILEVGAGVW